MPLTPEQFNKWQLSQFDVAINEQQRRFFARINTMADELKRELLSVDTISDMSKPQIDAFIALLVGVQDAGYQRAVSAYFEEAALLASYATESEALGLGVTAATNPFAVARTTPISASGELLDEHMATLVAYNNKRLADEIKRGWAAKTEVRELSALIIGTRKASFADGLMYREKTAAKAAIDTASHHVGQVSKAETWKANDIYRYRIVATLDGRTTQVCRGLDNEVFTYGASDARMPPFHYFCRTVIAPEIDADYAFLSEGRTRASMYGSVDANINYREWERQNPA